MTNFNPPPAWYEPPDEIELPELDAIYDAIEQLKLALDMDRPADIADQVRKAQTFLTPIIEQDDFRYEVDYTVQTGGFE